MFSFVYSYIFPHVNHVMSPSCILYNYIYIEPFVGINNVQNKHCLPTPMFAG